MTAPILPSQPQRNPRIDFLRGIAIFAVLILHFTLAFGLKNSPLGSLIPGPWLRAMTLNGNFGVTVFFVISGYLITSHSLARWGSLPNIRARQFYRMRAGRILPGLLLALAIIVPLGVMDVPFFNNSDDGHRFPASYFVIAAGSVLTFWHNALMQSVGYFNYCLNVYWSLSVEEVFYLALPISALLLRKTSALVAVCVVLIIVGPVYRSYHISNEIDYLYAWFACFDAIATGILTALLAQKWPVPARWQRTARMSAISLLVLFWLRGIDGHEVMSFSLIALASSLYLLGAHQNSAPGISTSRPLGWLRWLGQHSYELYLFHIVVLALMRNVMTKDSLSYALRLPWLVLFLGLSALAAYAAARWVTEPANAAIRRRTAAA